MHGMYLSYMFDRQQNTPMYNHSQVKYQEPLQSNNIHLMSCKFTAATNPGVTIEMGMKCNEAYAFLGKERNETGIRP